MQDAQPEGPPVPDSPPPGSAAAAAPLAEDGGPLHNMKVVSLRTGLTPDNIRVWEQRYNAVRPKRSAGRHRLYSDQDIERLSLLAELTRLGHSICRIARLPIPDLRSALAISWSSVRQRDNHALEPHGPDAPEIEALVTRMFGALKRYRTDSLERILDEGAVRFGLSGLMEKVLLPLLQRVGDEWQAGSINAAHDHAITQAVKDYLARHLGSMGVPESAPRLLVAIPSGQLHELGTIIAAGLARKAGWNVTYLGPSLPAEEIASAARDGNFRAVGMSLVHPCNDPGIPDQLTRLRALLPEEMPVIIGGRAVPCYLDAITRIGAIVVASMQDFTLVLGKLRDGTLQEAS